MKYEPPAIEAIVQVIMFKGEDSVPIVYPSIYFDDGWARVVVEKAGK